MRRKVTVVGAGKVGATTAQRLYDKGIADIVLVDRAEGLSQGKALDILESGPILGIDASIIGVNDYEQTTGSDIVVITAGVARRPGMSRDDLLFTNMDIVGHVVHEVVGRSPETILINVTNPVDAITQTAYETSGLPRERVIGMAGVLDTARFRSFVAQELDVSVLNVHAYVLGGHGATMVPLISGTDVAGTPISRLIPEKRLNAIVERTRNGGAEIVNLLKSGSAYYAPAAAVAQMVEAILLDRRQILPCDVYLQGEYGIDGLCIGVPVKLGAGGIREIIQLELSSEEHEALLRSAAAVQELVDLMHKRVAAP